MMDQPIESTIWAHDEFTIPAATRTEAMNAIIDRRVAQVTAILRDQGWVLKNGVSLSREKAGDGLSLINMSMLFVRVLDKDQSYP